MEWKRSITSLFLSCTAGTERTQSSFNELEVTGGGGGGGVVDMPVGGGWAEERKVCGPILKRTDRFEQRHLSTLYFIWRRCRDWILTAMEIGLVERHIAGNNCFFFLMCGTCPNEKKTKQKHKKNKNIFLRTPPVHNFSKALCLCCVCVWVWVCHL